jgi:hypothetical protein
MDVDIDRRHWYSYVPGGMGYDDDVSVELVDDVSVELVDDVSVATVSVATVSVAVADVSVAYVSVVASSFLQPTKVTERMRSREGISNLRLIAISFVRRSDRAAQTPTPHFVGLTSLV